MHRSRTEGWPGEVEDSGLPCRSKKNGKTMKLENLKDVAQSRILAAVPRVT